MELKRKDFTYRGKTLDELKALDVREFAKYLKSRERRATLRQFNEIEKFVARANKKIAKNRPVRTHNRDFVIVPRMVGMKIGVHDGKTFAPVEKEHLTENKKRLNEALLKEWGFVKKDKKEK